MSWLYERHVFPSAINGEIVVTRSYGSWWTSVNGTQQSGWFMQKLWKNAFTRLSPLFRPSRILLLGLGTGSAVSSIRHAFPSASLDAMEIDDVMIQLIKKFQFVSEEIMPNVMVGDVCERLPQMKDVYDLILVDLFHGADVPERISTAEFFTSIAKHLSPSGCVIVNVFADQRAIAAMKSVFSVTAKWKDLTNTVLMAQRPASSDFVPYRTSLAYLHREFGNRDSFRVVTDKHDVPSLIWNVGPLKFARRISEQPPEYMKDENRILLWQPICAGNIPKGWIDSPFPFSTRQTGYLDASDESYWSGWGTHAKRHRTAWSKQKEIDIIERSGTDVMNMTFPERFQRRVRESVPQHGDLVRVFLTYRKNNPKKIIAALAVVDVPEISVSIHLASYILPEVRKSSVGVGMICAWLDACRVRKIRFADFDIIWTPGDPKEWKGYSEFKLHFKPQIIRYPKPLLRVG
jgi:hypothetical protein